VVKTKMDEPRYHVRIRGVTSGPFDLGQLQTMRRMEQLARFHEVSPDGKTWVAASTLAGLFPPSSPGQRARRRHVADQPGRAPGFVPAPASESVPAPAVWFYESRDQSIGPITLNELHCVLARGEIVQETLVWAEGMPTWLPYNDVAMRGFTSPPLPAVADLAHEGSDPRPLADTSQAATISRLPPNPVDTSAPACRLAVASLVLGLTGWTCGIGSLLALAIGINALSRIKESQGRLEGKSLAITGLVLGAVGVVLDVAVGLIFFLPN
jgi:F0F1-type ATP synthase membrane subunit c/vacuolar-type H+-ATPase subunit K